MVSLFKSTYYPLGPMYCILILIQHCIVLVYIIIIINSTVQHSLHYLIRYVEYFLVIGHTQEILASFLLPHFLKNRQFDKQSMRYMLLQTKDTSLISLLLFSLPEIHNLIQLNHTHVCSLLQILSKLRKQFLRSYHCILRDVEVKLISK